MTMDLIQQGILQSFHDLGPRAINYSTYLLRLQELREDAAELGQPISDVLLDAKLRDLLRSNAHFTLLESSIVLDQTVAGQAYVPKTTPVLFAEILRYAQMELGAATTRGSTRGQPHQAQDVHDHGAAARARAQVHKCAASTLCSRC